MISRNGSKAIYEKGRTVPHHLIVLAVWLVFGFTGAGISFADIAPVISWTVEVTELVPYSFPVVSGETLILEPHFTELHAPKNLSGASLALMKVADSAGTVNVLTGTVYSATGGVCRIRWNIAATNGPYQYEISLVSSNSTLLRSFGSITPRKTISGDPVPITGYADTLSPSDTNTTITSDLAPVLAWDVDITAVTPRNWLIKRGESLVFQPRFMESGSPKDITLTHLVTMIYRPVGVNAWHYQKDGVVWVGSNGQARIHWDTSCSGTNDLYEYEIVAVSSNDVLRRCTGTISVKASLLDDVILEPAHFSGNGESGPQGPQGPRGAKGDAGATGAIGPQGFTGSQGPAGPQGERGLQGIQGPQGIAGETGPQGANGTNGVPGTNLTLTVFVGQEIGPAGPAGRDGRDGRDGTNGMTGATGAQGATGPKGDTGAQGPAGATGAVGRDGRDGQPGQDGIIGRDGLPGISPSISVTNTLTGNAACTNVGTSTNVVLQFTLPPGPQGPAGPGMTNMPACWDADLINTNRLSVKIGGTVIGYWDTNGITLYQGTLQLWQSDLYCNPWLYDGSKNSPSFGFAGHRGEFGAYSRGYSGQWGMGWCVRSNEVGMLWQYGIKLLSTNASFDGNHIGNAQSLTNYPEPILTNWLGSRKLPSMTITNAGSLAINDANGTNRVTLAGDGSLAINDANGTNRVKITTNAFTVTDNLNRLRFSITANTNNTAIIWYDTTNVVGIISNNGITLVNTNAMFSGNAGGLVNVPEPQFTNWLVTGRSMTALTITNSGALTVKDTGGTTRFSVDGSTGATIIRTQDSDARYVMQGSGNANLISVSMTNQYSKPWCVASNMVVTLNYTNGNPWMTATVTTQNVASIVIRDVSSNTMFSVISSNGATVIRGQDSDSRYVLVNTNWPSGNFTNLNLIGVTNLWKYQNGIVTNWTLL